jgi:hypothetical protein
MRIVPALFGWLGFLSCDAAGRARRGHQLFLA